jgi:predicted nucleotidyltransferase
MGRWPEGPRSAPHFVLEYRHEPGDILIRLKAHETALKARGVAHAALFGSVARDEQRGDSDIDILIELDPAARVTMFDYVDIKAYIAALFQGPADAVNRES